MKSATTWFTGNDSALIEQTYRRFTWICVTAICVISVVWFALGAKLYAGVLLALAALQWLLYDLRRHLGLERMVMIGTAIPALWLFVLVVFTGGPTSPRGVWLLLPPLVPALVFQAPIALRWTAAYCVVVLGIWGAHLAGVPFPNMLSAEQDRVAYAVSGLIAFFAIVGLTMVFGKLQQRALTLVRTAHLQLNSVFDTLPEGVIAVALEGKAAAHRITYMNPAMAELLGGMHTGGFLEDVLRTRAAPIAEKLLEHLRVTTASGGSLQRRIELSAPNRITTYEVNSRTLDPTATNLEIVSLVRDLSEQIETQHRAMHAAKMASVGELVAGVAHELNNPLTAIKSTAELLADAGATVHDEDIRRIHDNADRAARIVRSLLSFARETPPEREPTDLNQVVHDALRLRSASPDVRIELDLQDGLPTTQADRGQIEQVVLNLLSNAEHALREARARAPRITVRTRAATDVVALEVADNGAGIADHILPRIFDPFFTTRQVGKGTGLGLAVAHGIIAKHGGSIRARSEAGKGATFTLELPRTPGRAESRTDDALPGPDPARIEPRTVLIVDDEESIRSVLGRYLRRRGHHVVEAASGDEAASLAADRAFDAIVLDIKMPGLSGDELFRRWRRDGDAAADRVIFATGDIVSAATSGFLSSTGQPALGKPYDLVQIAELVESVAAQAAAYDEHR